MRLVQDKLNIVEREQLKEQIIEQMKQNFMEKYQIDAFQMAELEQEMDQKKYESTIQNYIENSVE